MSFWFTIAGLAAAQEAAEAPEIDAQLFHPSIGSEHTLWVDEVGTRSEPTFHGGELVHYARNPLVESGPEGELVTDILQLDTVIGLHVGRISVGTVLPVLLFARGEGTDETALGDIGLDAKGVILDPETAPLGLGIGGRMFLPTATTHLALGAEDVGYEVEVLAERALGPVTVFANAGTIGGPEAHIGSFDIDDFFLGRMALGHAFPGHAGLALEGSVRLPYTAPPTSHASSAEWLATGYGGVGHGLVLHGGAGTGIGHGIGAPSYRFLFGVGWAPEHEAGEHEPVSHQSHRGEHGRRSRHAHG